RDEPLRELALELAHFLSNFGRHVQRVRPGRLIDRQSRRGPTIEREDLRVGLGSELDPAYVTESRDLTGAAGFDDHRPAVTCVLAGRLAAGGPELRPAQSVREPASCSG